MSNIALLIAGGSGNRMHQDIPKQFNITKLQYVVGGGKSGQQLRI